MDSECPEYKRTIYYIRVEPEGIPAAGGSSRTGRRISYEEQKAMLDRYCDKHGYELDSIFQDLDCIIRVPERDDDLEEPVDLVIPKEQRELSILLRNVRNVKIKQRILVYSIDRLSTDMSVIKQILDKVISSGSELIDIKSKINFGQGQGLVMYSMIRDLTNDGKRTFKIEKKKVTLGTKKAPYGWRSTGYGGREKIESEQKVLRMIKTWKEDNPKLTPYELAKMLNDKGIDPPGKSQKWYYERVKQIIQENELVHEEKEKGRARDRLRAQNKKALEDMLNDESDVECSGFRDSVDVRSSGDTRSSEGDERVRDVKDVRDTRRDTQKGEPPDIQKGESRGIQKEDHNEEKKEDTRGPEREGKRGNRRTRV